MSGNLMGDVGERSESKQREDGPVDIRRMHVNIVMISCVALYIKELPSK